MIIKNIEQSLRHLYHSLLDFDRKARCVAVRVVAHRFQRRESIKERLPWKFCAPASGDIPYRVGGVYALAAMQRNAMHCVVSGHDDRSVCNSTSSQMLHLSCLSSTLKS